MHHDSLKYKLHFYYSSGARSQLLSHVSLCDPMDCRLHRQGYWDGLPFPAPGGLPDPGIKHASALSPALAGGFITVPSVKPIAVGGGLCLPYLSMAK